jgi:hypothetical protein
LGDDFKGLVLLGCIKTMDLILMQKCNENIKMKEVIVKVAECIDKVLTKNFSL